MSQVGHCFSEWLFFMKYIICAQELVVGPVINATFKKKKMMLDFFKNYSTGVLGGCLGCQG